MVRKRGRIPPLNSSDGSPPRRRSHQDPEPLEDESSPTNDPVQRAEAERSFAVENEETATTSEGIEDQERQADGGNAEIGAGGGDGGNDSEEELEQRPPIQLEELLNVQIPPLVRSTMNSDGTGKRLIIAQIVNENFKSYFGRHIIGPFHTNFTSIVGPNGSGKSNVIDSILFVFGFKASKMRFKKMKEVIHSKRGEEIYSCSVEIHFEEVMDKPDGSFVVVPNSRLEVRRTANRDNVSNYYLNGRKTNYKDVARQLRAKGIDLDHNRFLILQGEVEQIAQMQPKAAKEGDTDGMLEYLEDIIGSSRLKEPLETLNKAIEELTDERQEKLNRLKQAEKEKSDLEGPRDQAIEFFKEENKLNRKQHLLAQINLVELAKNAKEAGDFFNEVNQEYQDRKEKIETMKQEIDEKKKTMRSVQKKHDQAAKEKETAQEEFKDMEAKNVRYGEEIKSAKGKQKAKDLEIGKLEKQIEEAEGKPEKLEKETEKLRQILEEDKKKQKSFSTEYDEVMAKVPAATQDLEAKKKTFQQELLGMQNRVGDAKNKMNVAQKEVDLRTGGYDSAMKLVAEVETAMEQNRENIATSERTLADVEKELPKKQAERAETQQAVAKLEQEHQKTQVEYEMLKVKVSEERADMKESKSSNDLTTSLMAERAAGRIKGIFGRLGDLGSIDKRFDVAISTACGVLDNILVDTSETATQCIQYLKDNNKGRGNFLALDVVTKRMHDQLSTPFNPPNHSERLFDKIQTEPKFLPAFYHGLRNTLVVDNIDTATAVGMGHQRHRVVTLDGKLVESSGTMTGGGGKPSSGKMGTARKSVGGKPSTSPEELKRMEGEIDRLGRAVEEIRRKKYDASTRAELLEQEVGHLESTRVKAEGVLKGAKQQWKTYENSLKSLRKKAEDKKPSEADLAKLNAAAASAKSDYDKCSAEEGKVQAKVEELNREIERITYGIAGNVKERLEQVTRDIEEHEKTIVKNTTAVKNSDRNIRKLKDRLESAAQEKEEAGKTIEAAKQKMEELVEMAAGLAKTAKAAETLINTLKDELKTLQSDVKETEAEEQKLGVEFIKLKTDKEKAAESVKKIEKKIEATEKQMKSLSLHNIREFLELDPEEGEERTEEPQRKSMRVRKDRRTTLMEEEEVEGQDEAEPDVGSETGGEQSRMDVDEEEEEAGPSRGRLQAEEDEEKLGVEFQEFTEEELAEIDHNDLLYEITALRESLGKRKPDLSVLIRFKEKLLKYRYCYKEHDRVNRQREQVKEKHEELRKQRFTEFQDGFNVISLKLKEMYQMITLGGDAELEFVDSLDPFADGISFTVRPPKKSWKQISNLSGGERTLSSLALVFALHHYKPTPLYVMDEIDAALDFKNVSIIAHYIKDRTKNAQFIIISLRNNMFELADRLVGIYKTFNCTKHVVINPNEISLEILPHPKVLQPVPSQV